MVKPKQIVIIIIAAVVIGGISAGAVYFLQNRESAVSPLASGQTASSATAPASAEKLITWNDPAGFTFRYPDGLNLNKHDEDNQNYAHLEFTSKSHPGSLVIWAKDTSAADAASWFKSEKR